MALINCKECGHEVSTSAKACPNCGASVKTTSTFTWLVLIMIVLGVIGFLLDNNENKTSTYQTLPQQKESLNYNSNFEESSNSHPQKISIDDFEIISYRGEWRYDTLWIIGEIKNNGGIAAGSEVEVIARDSKGMLIASSQFWPNSISNTSPGSTTGINAPITEDRRAKTIEAKVIRVKIWN